MDRLAHLYHEFGQSPWLDNLKRGYITSGQLQPPGRQGHSRPHQQSRRSSRRRSRARPTTTSSSARSPRRTTRSSTTTGRWCSPTSTARSMCSPTCTTTATVPTASPASRSLPISPTTAPGTEAAARHLHEQIHRPNLMVKIPATAEGVQADRGDDRRRSQHQRHVDLQPRSLRRGDGGLHRRPRALRQTARSRSVEGGQRRQLLHQPGRHRDRSTSRDHRHTRGAGAARQGCRGPGQAGLPDVPAGPSAAHAGRRWPPRALSCSDRCGPARRPRTRPTPTRCTSTS